MARICTLFGLALGLSAPALALQGQALTGVALVRQVPAINGGATVEGSIHMMSGGSVNLNGGATITGDLLVPGAPTVRLNGNPSYVGTVDGAGATSPSNYTITLNGGAKLAHVVRRTAPVSLPAVPNPPAPAGTRSVNLNKPGESPGTWGTLRDLTLNGNVGQMAVPPGTYGDFTANSGAGFTFGVAGATEAAVYNFQRFNLNGQSQIRVVGPVVINLRNGFSANGPIGSSEQPGWLKLNVASGAFNLNGGSSLYAILNAPASGVIINGNSRLVGGLVSQSLIINSGGLLRLAGGGVTPPANTAPVASAQSVSTPEDTARAITLGATDAEGDALTYTVVTPPAHGTLSGVAPALVYTPTADFHGTDGFAFRARDGALDSNIATVSFTVTPVNDAPGAQNQALAAVEGEQLSITLTGTDREGSALTYAIINAPASGVLSGNPPNLAYSPPGNTDATVTFTFKVNDGELDSPPATVSVAVTNRNLAPVASGAELVATEDEPLVIELAADDADGDALTYALHTPPTRGTVNIAGHVATYTPHAHATGSDAFLFTVSDGGLTSSPATIALTITPVNDAPSAAGQTLAVNEDGSLSLTLAGGDADGDSLTYAIVQQPANGVLSGVAPNLVYTPAPDFHGADEFTFTVADATLTSAPATIAITVNPVNDAPIALAQELAVNEGATLAITLAANDVDGDALSYAIIESPALGALVPAPGSPAGAPNYLYTPPTNRSGAASFTFRANDSAADSAPATVTIAYSNINDAPVATGVTVALDEDAAATFVLPATDPDGDALSYGIASAPAHGVVTIDGNRATYTPTADFHGADEFTFVVTDAGEPALASAPATVLLSVRPVNDAPTATSLASATAEDEQVAVTLAGADIDGDALSYEIVTAPAHGTLSGVASALIYTPAANFHGADAFAYRVSDGRLESAAALVAITVTPVNDAPVAEPAGFAVTEGETLPILLAATDVDGDTLSYEIVTPPARGALAGEPPALSYTPPANTEGLVEFSFVARDGQAVSAPAVVSIEIHNVFDAPVATPQTLAVAEDASVAFTLSGVDPDGDALSCEVLVPPAHGTLSGATPALTYTPDANFHGVDTLLFVVRDAALESAPATVTFMVAPVNDAPVAAGQAVTTPEDVALPIILAGTDADGDALVFSIVDAPVHGALSGEAPNLVYTPATDYHGGDSFTFTVGDGALVSARATIEIAVTRSNDAPTGQARALSLAEDAALAITLAGVDPDGDALNYAVTIAPEHGTLGGEAPNLSYTPAPDYHGEDAFAFTVDDGELVSAAATVTLTITPVNDAPRALAQDVTVAANASAAILLAAVDPEGDAPLSYAVAQAPAHGVLSGVAPALVYEPDYGYSGPDGFAFTAFDGAATSAPQLVTITVTPPTGNQAPRVSLDPIAPAPLPFTAFELVAFARDADGEVALVEYFVNGAPIGSATKPVAGDATRFAFLLERGLAAGAYVFTARVTDDEGVTAVSAPISLAIAYDPNARTFTSTADFEEGLVRTLKSEGDELTTALLPTTFDYVWVSNSSAGTIVRLDSETGRVVGVYRSAPEGSPAFPSSIAVDSEGNAWVANRSGNSVVKIGLGLENGGWVDRDRDLSPDTSGGQGEILSWPAGGEPADEHILLRVQTAVVGLDHIAVDADNNVWVGGYGGKWQLIDGKTGAILREENHPGGGVGGRGGFIDIEGVQVSTGVRFMRWDTAQPSSEYDRTFAANVREKAWGVARDAEGNYWVTQDWSPVLEKYSAAGEKLGTYKHGSQWGQGITIDGDGHIWVAHSHCGDTVGHLLPDGTWIGNVKVANHGPTEVSVDRLGRIWVVSTTGVVERINPLGGKIGLDGETPVGEVDLRSPQLGGTLWTYGRFVGDSQALKLQDGMWSFSHDSRIPGATWGPVLWNAILANDAVVAVEVSLSENGATYGPWQALTLESPTPVGAGRYLRGRVKLDPSSEGYCPVMFDLTVGTAGYHTPAVPRRWFAHAGEDQSANWPDKVQLKGATWHSAHAWNETPAYQWSLAGFTPLAVGGGTAPVGGSVVFSDATDPRSQATFSGVGEYRLRLASTLDGVTSFDEVLVRLTPYNKLPYVSANEHLFLRDHAETAILDGVARDDGLPLGGVFVSTWEKAFGPGNVAFADAHSPVTTATFDAPGLYVLRIRGHDGELQSTSGMSVYAGLECSEPPPRGLISWWQANGGGSDHISGNQAFPEQGANYAEGHVGPAFNFDGVNDRVHVFGNDTMNVGARGGFGMEFWIRPSEGREAILMEYGTGANTRGVSIRQSGTALVVDFKDVAGASHEVVLGSALPAGVWTHLSINYDQASGWVHLFRNGEWSLARAIGSFTLQTGYDFRLGASWASDRFFKGLLDEVSLYDRALTQPEAWRVYAEGRAGKRRPVTNAAPVVNAGGDYVALHTGAPVRLLGSVTDDGMPLYQTVRQSWVVVSGPADAVVDFVDATDPRTMATFSKPGLYTLRLEADDGAFCTKKTVQVRVAMRDAVEAPSGLLAWWPGNRTTEEMVSGRMEPGVNVAYADGKVGSALEFDRTNRRVLVEGASAQTNVGALANGFTLEMWMRNDLTSDGSGKRVLAWAKDGVEGLRIYAVNAAMVLQIPDGAGSVWSMNFMPSATWEHVAFAYDRTTRRMKLYKAGALAADNPVSEAQASVLMGATGGEMYMGGLPFRQSGEWFDGGLDEVTFYDRPLSAGEIAAIHAAGAAGKQPIDENEAPVVSAGPDQGVSSASGTATLHGQVSDDGLPSGGLTKEWTQIFGPAGATINAPTEAQTTVGFTQAGHYGFKLTASDGLATRSDMVEVRVASAAGPQAPSGLLAWWPGNRTTEEMVSGRMEPGVNVTYTAEGKVGWAFEFDRTNRRVLVEGASAQTNVGALANGFTLEMWMRNDLTGDGSGKRVLAWTKNGTAGLTVFAVSRELRLEVPGQSYWWLGDMPSAAWEHVAFAYDRAAGRMRLYRAGSLVREDVVTAPQAAALAAGTAGELYMGGLPFEGSLSWFDGGLDEATFYDRPLSAGEIAAIHAAGAAGKQPLGENEAPVVSAGPDQGVSSASGTATLHGQVSDDGLPSGGLTKTWTQIFGPAGATINAPTEARTTVGFTQAGHYGFKLTASDGLAMRSDTVEVRVASAAGPQAPSGLLAWWPGNRTTEEMVSGRMEPGVNVTYAAEGKVGSAFEFDRTNRRVLVEGASAQTNVGALAKGFTLEMWMRNDRTGDGNGKRVLAWAKDGVAGLTVFAVSTELRLEVPGQSYWWLGSMPSGTWEHVAFAYDRAAGRMKLYRAGSLVSESPVSAQQAAALAARTSGELYVGGLPFEGSLSWFHGGLDEVTFYDRPLSAGEIAAIHAAGAAGKAPIPQPPVVQLTEPLTSGLYVNGASVTLQAVAYERSAPIASVEFYDGQILLGSVTQPDVASESVFTFVHASGLGLGAHTLTAVATDTGGVSARSAPVVIEVIHAPPAVSLISHAEGAAVPARLPLTLTATAAYTGGPVERVEFYSGTTKLGEVTQPDLASSPATYTFVYPAGLIPGARALSAKAIAADGAVGVSAPVNVLAEIVSPVVAVTVPSDGVQIIANSALTLQATASVGAGSIERVEFYAGSLYLGVATAPSLAGGSLYQFTHTVGLPVGSHVLTARAIAALSGATTTSPPVAVVAATYSGPEVVELVAPIDGASVTSPVEVTGIVARRLLASWIIEYRETPPEGVPASSAPWTTLASGFGYMGTPAIGGAVAVPAALATFDPGRLPNGLYQLRLSAIANDGTTLRDFPRTVLVDGKLKLGAVDSTVLDLEIPAPGFPLRIERRYSSLDKSAGDFGPGATLASSSVRLQVSQAIGADWFGYTVPGPLGIPLYRIDPAAPEEATGVAPAPRVVAITLADHTVLRFEAELSPKQQIAPPSTARMIFKPMAGTTGSLVPLDDAMGVADQVVLSNYTDYLDLLDPDTAFPLNPAAYRLTTLDGAQYIIDAAGGLLFQRDPNGNSITYTRDAIIHSSGVRLTLTRDAAGRITRVTDPAGRQVNYAYDAAGRLISATDANGQATGYGYVGTTSLVASIRPPAAVLPTYNVFDALERFVARVDAMQQGTTMEYDRAAFTQTKRDPLGHATVYQYDTYGNVTAVTDPLGRTTRHVFGDSRFPGLATQVTNHLGESVRTTYNAQGRAATITDPLGRVTSYAYDSAGRLLSETDPLGRAVTRAYDAKGNVLSVIDRAGAVTRYTYDAAGNPLTVTDALNNVSTFTYNSSGLPLTEVDSDAQGRVLSRRAFAYDAAGGLASETVFQTGADGVAQARVTAYTRDAAGRVLTVTHPDGRVVTRTYTPAGELATEITPENGLVTRAYDAVGRLTRIDFADGSHEATAYDVAGRITSRTDRGGFTTSYAYDAAGRLTAETLPDGGVIERAYDAAGRLVSETDDAGRVTATAYDAAGNPVGITHPDGTVTTLVYDAADNVATRTVRAFAEPEFAAITPLARSVAALGGADDVHRLAQSTGGGGSPLPPTGGAPARLFRFAYDANHRLTEVIHPDGVTKATIAYDLLGRPTRVQNERGAVWTYEYEGASAMRRTRVSGPENYVENYEYDELANITAQIDGRGRRVETSYNVFKPVQIRYRDIGADSFLFSSVSHDYDAKGRLKSIVDRRSFETTFAYPTDGEGDRQISRAEGPGSGGQIHLTAEDYDARGNLLSVTDARGSVTRYEYDFFNRRTLVVHPDGVRERTIYGAGNTVARTELVSSSGDVLATSYGYDANGRLTSVTHPDGAAESFAFDADGRITRRTDERGHATTYAYDDMARAVTVTDAEGGVTRHRFDAVGNLLETTDARGHRTVFEYDLLGRQTARTEAAGTNVARTTRFTYDLNGNIVSRIEAADTADSRTTTYAYDADNRLLLTSFPDGSTVRTERDADGNLLTQTDELGRATSHAYDAFGRITRLTDALQHVTTYAYPGFGARTERTDPLGRVFTDHFDARQRLILRESDGGAWLENLGYDAFGRLASRTERRASSVALDAARVTAFAYDDRGRVSTVTHPSGGVETFGYDDAGNLETVTDPRGFATTFTYDRLNRRTRETRDGAANETARATAFAYDPVGNLTALTRPGGQIVSRIYDQLNRPQAVSVALNSTETYSLSLLHDVFDRVYATEDARGRNEFTYDSRDRLLTETDALGHSRASTYDAAGNRLTATDERGFTTGFTYDELGRVVSAAMPGGANRAYVFDAAGRLTESTLSGFGTADQAAASPDLVTTFGYDGLDRVVSTTVAGITESATYDGSGRLLTSSDGEEFTTTHDYSPGGFLQRVTFPDGTSRSWTHDVAGNILTATDELGKTTATHTYNGFGELSSVTDAVSAVTTFDYDVEGRMIAVHAPLERTTTHAYDLAGRRVSTVLPDGTELAFAYDLFGNLVRRTDQLGRDTTYAYDARDRLLSVTTPISSQPARSATASYTYDPAGNLATITDPLGQVTRFEHDAAGRLAATFLPLRPGQAHERRTYDHADNLIDLTDGNGHVTRHGYDARGLLRSVRPADAFGQPAILHTYDGRGLRTTMTDRLGVTAYVHDERGRLTSKSTPYAGRLSYGYDAAGRLTALATTGSGGVNVAYGYDAADRLVSVNDARFGATSYGYDAAGRLTTQTLPSGLHTTHGYDAMDRLLSAETRASASPAAAVVEAYAYTRTLTGQIASELSSGGRLETYAYDHSDRLVRQVVSGDSSGQNGSLAYTLDAIGNRLARASTIPGLPSQNFEYDANHAVEGYDYDDHGNPVAGAISDAALPAPGAIADSYDFRHALASRHAQVAYLYDGDGERVGRRVWNPVALAWDDTYYLNDSLPSAANPLGLSQTLEERAPGGALQRLYSPAPRRLAVAERHVLASSGGAFSVALAADGTVLAWGDNSAGQLGDGGTASARANPAPVPGLDHITRVVAGSEFAAALRADGVLLWWGNLGSASQSAPAVLADLPPLASVAAGADFLVALATDGTVWTFGDNTSGQLGNGGFGSSSVPVQVPGLTGIAEVAAGAVHALALDAAGQVRAWGGNTSRQLGDPAYASTASTLPLAVPGLVGVVELSGGARHTLALDLDGVVYAWGDNASGQLGDGTRTVRAAAEPVTGLGQSAVSVAAGGWHSLAALADGTVRAWGSHAEGQGAGAHADDQLSPAAVNGLVGVTRVTAGARHSLAMNDAGQWFGWGSNRDGQLGLTGTVGGATPSALAAAGLADVIGGIDSASGLFVVQAQRYYGYDAQGSVRYQTDAAGAVVARYDYDAFGTLLGAVGESPLGSDAYLYRGERYDALTGLYHLRARDYDPALGRFHQIDDFAGFTDNPYSLNRYNYAESNPVGKHDPAGRFAVTNIGTAMMALHIKNQYLNELASAGPRFTFDIDEALNRYLMTDGLVASSAPLKLKERELWVRSSGGGLLGSWVGSSGSSEQTEKIAGQGFGAGSDAFFLHQSGARFRQGWLLRAVEHSWGSLQQSRANLNLGPRLPDDPRSKRIEAGSVSLKGARWADVIYADALLQASLRSATDAGSAGVRARFTATLEARRYTTTSLDLTARAISALGASLGGGPVDWQMPIMTGTNRHATAVETNLRSLEQSDGEIFADAFAQHVDKLISAEVFLRGYEMPDGSRTGLMFVGSMYNQYTELKDAGVDDRGTWAAMVYGHLPVVASGTSAAYALAKGRDFHSGDVLSAGQQALQAGAFGLEFVLSGGIGASRNTWRANAPNIREVADSVKAGAGQLRADTAAFARGFDAASGRAMAGQFNSGVDPTPLFKGIQGGVKSIRDARAAAWRGSSPGDAEFIGPVDIVGPRIPQWAERVTVGSVTTQVSDSAVSLAGRGAYSYDYLVHMAQNTLDFSTKRNGAVFWSGPRMLTAQKWAQGTGKTTLEQTTGGRFLNDLDMFEVGSGVSKHQAANIWDIASARFTADASGTVNAFSTGAKRISPYTGQLRTWWRIELPGLRANPNVDGIIRRRVDGGQVGDP